MTNCINTTSKEFKDLVETSGLSSLAIEAKINIWAKKTGEERFPTLEELGLRSVKDIETKEEDLSEENKSEEKVFEKSVDTDYSLFDHLKSEEEVFNEPNPFDREDDSRYNTQDLNESQEEMLKDSKYAKLAEHYIYKLNDIESNIKSLKSDYKHSDKSKRKEISRKIQELENKASEIRETILATNRTLKVKQLGDFGNNAVVEVSDLLKKDSLSINELMYAQRIIDFWKRCGDFSSSEFGHPLFGDATVGPGMKEALRVIAGKMQDLENRPNDGLYAIEKNRMAYIVSQELGGKWKPSEIFAEIKDISILTANLYNLATTGNPILSAVYTMMEKAKMKGRVEYNKNHDELQGSIKKAKPKLKSLAKDGNIWDIFFQEKNGIKTGKIVSMFSQDYYDAKNKLLAEAQKAKGKEAKSTAWKNYYDFIFKNEMQLDLRLLDPDEHTIQKFKDNPEKLKELADKHRKEIIDLIGEKSFNNRMDAAMQIIMDYNSAKELFEEQLDDRVNDQNNNFGLEDKAFFLEKWEKENSPYYELDRRIGVLNSDGTISDNRIVFMRNVRIDVAKGIRMPYSIPKKYVDGKKTGWYDSKYEVISKDKDLLELYEHMHNILSYLNSILPPEMRGKISRMALPYISKQMTDSFGGKEGFGMTNLWDAVQKSFTIDSLSDVNYAEVTPEGKDVKKVKLNLQFQQEKHIEEIIERKAIELLANTGINPTVDDLQKFRKEAIEELNEARSFDLEKIMNVYMANVMAYNHKSNISDALNLAQRMVNKIPEIKTSKTGQQTKNWLTKDGETKVGLDNMQKMLDYAMREFYGLEMKDTEGVKKDKKMLSLTEKKQLAEWLSKRTKIEDQINSGKIDKEVGKEALNKIDSEIEKIGGYFALSKLGDNILRYVQLKGMGLNVIASGVNLTTGYIEGFIRAADGRFYTYKQFRNGMKDAWAASLDFGNKSELSQKVNAIERFFGLVHTEPEGLYEKGLGRKITEGAFILNTKTEFVNVMSQAIAMLQNIKVKDNNGKESTLYDAFNTDGSIKNGWILSDKMSNDDFLITQRMNLAQIRNMSAGDYESPMMFKSKWVGRAIMQFRTWMPELIKARFGNEYENKILGKTIKGRWRSYGSTLKSREYNGNVYSAANNILYTLGQLCKKMVFMRTSFDGRMSEVDAANMRANMMELHFILGMMTALLILTKGLDDDDKKNFRINMLINMLIRQQTDLTMFANPNEFESLSKNFIGATSVFSDINKLGWAVAAELNGKGEYTTGVYDGWDKTVVATMKMTPFLNQGLRIYRYGEGQLNTTQTQK